MILIATVSGLHKPTYNKGAPQRKKKKTKIKHIKTRMCLVEFWPFTSYKYL